MGCILTKLRRNHPKSHHDRENLVKCILTKLRRNHPKHHDDQANLLNKPLPPGILRQRRADYYITSSWDEIYQTMEAQIGDTTCVRGRKRGSSFLENFWADLQRMQAEKREQQRHVRWWDQ